MKCILAILALTTIASANARAQVSASEILAVALAHVRADLPSGRVVINEKVLAGAGSIVNAWSRAEGQKLSASIPGSVVAPEAAHFVCKDPSRPATCVLDVDAMVTVGRPLLARDTASVLVSVRTARGSGNDRVDYRVKLVRSGGGWVVATREIAAQP